MLKGVRRGGDVGEILTFAERFKVGAMHWLITHSSMFKAQSSKFIARRLGGYKARRQGGGEDPKLKVQRYQYQKIS